MSYAIIRMEVKNVLAEEGDFDAGVFELVGGEGGEQAVGVGAGNGGDGAVVVDYDFADLLFGEASFLDEVADDVAARDFFFLAGVEI